MSDDPAQIAEQAATQLCSQIEGNAGAIFIGPNARMLRFSFDRQQDYPLAYLTVAMDGFKSADEARAEMFQFALAHPFNVLGNVVQLRRTPNLAPGPGSYPQGSILMWRGEGGKPRFGADADSFWSVQMTYCLLPPFAHVTG